MTQMYNDLLNELRDVKPKTYVGIVFDQSGSMSILKNEVVDGLNAEINGIKESSIGQDVKLSLTFFSNKVDEPLFWNKDINDFKDLTEKQYNPSGMTALYDAIGITIDKIYEEPDIEDENTSILMLIVTDGMENASRKFTSAKIFSKIDELQKTGRWTFSYIGTGDLKEVSDNLGFSIGNMKNFVHDNVGYTASSINTTESYRKYFDSRTIGAKASDNFFSNTEYSEVAAPKVSKNFPKLDVKKLVDVQSMEGAVDSSTTS